jgi:hypothetical protein
MATFKIRNFHEITPDPNLILNTLEQNSYLLEE